MSADTIAQLKITLNDVKPTVLRREPRGDLDDAAPQRMVRRGPRDRKWVHDEEVQVGFDEAPGVPVERQ